MSAYDALSSWVAGHGGTPAGDPWEVYLSQPGGDPAHARTEVTQLYT